MWAVLPLSRHRLPSLAHVLSSAKPVLFLKALDDMSAEERSTLTLQCEVSDPQAHVVWRKDGVELGPSDKYDFLHKAGIRGLVVHDLSNEDAGLYTCHGGSEETRSRVSVHGEWPDLPCGVVLGGRDRILPSQSARPLSRTVTQVRESQRNCLQHEALSVALWGSVIGRWIRGQPSTEPQGRGYYGSVRALTFALMSLRGNVPGMGGALRDVVRRLPGRGSQTEGIASVQG